MLEGCYALLPKAGFYFFFIIIVCNAYDSCCVAVKEGPTGV